MPPTIAPVAATKYLQKLYSDILFKVYSYSVPFAFSLEYIQFHFLQGTDNSLTAYLTATHAHDEGCC